MLFRFFLQALIILWSWLVFAFDMKVGVKVEETQQINLYDSYIATGEVSVATSRDFYAKTPGTITYITDKQGKPVKAGDKILEINGPSTQKMYDKAIAAAGAAEFTFKRDRGLFEKKLISEDAFKRGKLAYESSLHDLEKAKQEYEEMIIKAPFDGSIGVVSKRVGNNVSVGDHLINITNGNDREIIAYLPEKLLKFIKLDTRVEIIVHGKSPSKAQIFAIAPHISRTTGNFTIKIAANSEEFNHGSFIKLQFFLNEHKGLAISEHAIQKNENGNFVFVINGELKAQKIYVTLGSRVGDKVEILSGLKEGEKVVVAGLNNLDEGSLVRIIE